MGKYKPSEEYLKIIIEGAKEHNLPSKYIDKILEIVEEHGVNREIIEKCQIKIK
ncbi:MAG: hypothetical protein DRN95_05345 [Candidatus Hydrothermarchaeota archaeon]|nr:MAG: hypothetical protein DRN95_05345 [Candidatus Hydrothermarchaeota archaeon]